MTITIITFFLLFYVALAWWRLDWAFLLMLASLPSYVVRFDFFVPVTLLELMILICFFVWLLKDTNFIDFFKGKYKLKDFKENRKRRKHYPFSFEIILLLLISYTAAAVSGFTHESLGIWKAYFFEPILVYILALNILKDKCGLRKSFWALSISMLAVSLFGFYQKITGDFIPNGFWAAEESRRITSFFGYPNAVGLYLGPLILVMIGFFGHIAKPLEYLDKKVRIKLLYLLIVISFSTLSLYFARSEGAIIAVTSGIVIYGLISGKWVRLITVVLVFVTITGAFFYQPVKIYAIEKLSLKDLSGEIRKQQWRETWAMLKDGRMIMGSGLANYQDEITSYHQEGIFFNYDKDPDFRRKIVLFDDSFKYKYWQPTEVYLYPHNIVLNFWVELGILGAALFIWLILKFILKSLRLMHVIKTKAWINEEKPYAVNLIKGLIGAMTVIVVHGLVDVPYFKNDLSIVFWLLFALLGILYIQFSTIQQTLTKTEPEPKDNEIPD